MSDQLAAPATAPLQRGVAVYIIALAYCVTGGLTLAAGLSIFAALPIPVWEIPDLSLQATLVVPLVTQVLLSFAAGAAVFAMRQETLLFQGCLLAWSVSRVNASAQGIIEPLIVPALLIFFSVRLALQGKLR